MIQATQLSKVFHDKKRGKIRAVDGVSFMCRPGEIYGLLGVNGAALLADATHCFLQSRLVRAERRLRSQ